MVTSELPQAEKGQTEQDTAPENVFSSIDRQRVREIFHQVEDLGISYRDVLEYSLQQTLLSAIEYFSRELSPGYYRGKPKTLEEADRWEDLDFDLSQEPFESKKLRFVNMVNSNRQLTIAQKRVLLDMIQQLAESVREFESFLAGKDAAELLDAVEEQLTLYGFIDSKHQLTRDSIQIEQEFPGTLTVTVNDAELSRAILGDIQGLYVVQDEGYLNGRLLIVGVESENHQETVVHEYQHFLQSTVTQSIADAFGMKYGFVRSNRPKREDADLSLTKQREQDAEEQQSKSKSSDLDDTINSLEQEVDSLQSKIIDAWDDVSMLRTLQQELANKEQKLGEYQKKKDRLLMRMLWNVYRAEALAFASHNQKLFLSPKKLAPDITAQVSTPAALRKFMRGIKKLQKLETVLRKKGHSRSEIAHLTAAAPSMGQAGKLLTIHLAAS